MTANQLVAYNLRRIRERDGLTQEKAAEMLEPLLGRRWSKATFSAAETSVSSGRTREFSANEILAFSVVFGVPVGWFFLPADEGEPERESVSCGGPEELDAEALVRAVAPKDNPLMRERFSGLGDERNVGIDRIGSVVTDAVVRALAERPARLGSALAKAAARQTPQSKGGSDAG